mmetsp:Transcript_2499/g.5727  ORF Transcript_2499/g.5727 Transcript_2499/m.5727 type:complete len:236 (-) Transcript_2499:327-1034(-)
MRLRLRHRILLTMVERRQIPITLSRQTPRIHRRRRRHTPLDIERPPTHMGHGRHDGHLPRNQPPGMAPRHLLRQLRPSQPPPLANTQIPKSSHRRNHLHEIRNGIGNQEERRPTLPTPIGQSPHLDIHLGQRLDRIDLQRRTRRQSGHTGLFHRLVFRLDDADDGGVWGHYARDGGGEVGGRGVDFGGSGGDSGAGGEFGGGVFGFSEGEEFGEEQDGWECEDVGEAWWIGGSCG